MKRILLIENNQEICDNISSILKLANYEVTLAHDGKSGLAVAQQKIPDLIICDLSLPELDGISLLRMLARHPEFNLVPFILISKEKTVESVRQLMDMGADDFIINPVDHTELLKTVDIHLMKMEKIKASLPKERNNGEFTFNHLLHTDHARKKYKKKQPIFNAGDNPTYLFYILSGKAKSYIINEEGKELTITLYAAGDFIGASALLANTVYATNATAIDEVELALIPKDEFKHIISKDSALSQDIMLRLKNANTLTSERLLKFAYDSARKRVADSLLYVRQKYAASFTNMPVLEIGRRELASLAGIAKESTIRTLTDFKEEKLIDIENGKIILLNEEKLRHLPN